MVVLTRKGPLRRTDIEPNMPIESDLAPDGNFLSRNATAQVNSWRRRGRLFREQRIVRNRDAWIEVVGTRDASWLAFYGMHPGFVNATDKSRKPDEPTYFLGFAPQDCQRHLLTAVRS